MHSNTCKKSQTEWNLLFFEKIKRSIITYINISSSTKGTSIHIYTETTKKKTESSGNKGSIGARKMVCSLQSKENWRENKKLRI